MDRGQRGFASEEDEAHYYLELLRSGSKQEKIEARDGLARIFERRGQLDEAAECYETNILEGVRDRDVYERLARIYRKQGRNDLADEVIEETLKLPGGAATQPLAPIPSPPAREPGAGATQPMRPPLIDDLEFEPYDRPREAAGVTAPAAVGARPWYAHPAIVVLGVLLLGPIGLTNMWVNARWTNLTKWIVSAIWWGAFLLLSFAAVQANLVSIADIVAGQYGAPEVAPSPIRTPAVPITSPGLAASPPPFVPKASPPPAAASPPPAPAIASPVAKPGVPTPPPTGQVRVANTEGQGVSLRERPSTSSNRLKLLPEGAVLDIVGPDIPAEDKVWRNVRDATGTTGWVVSDYLAPAGQ